MPLVTKGKENVTVPSLIVVGARKSGTASLFRMLGQHPDVASIVPEVYVRGSMGFMAQDPATYPMEAEWAGDRLETELPAEIVGNVLSEYSRPYILAESREEGNDNKILTTELSPAYLASPLAPYRLKGAMPDVKVVLLLRDPVDRYFSELRDKLCVYDESRIDWDDIASSFAGVSASKSYLSEAVLDYSPYDKVCLGEGASPSDLWRCKEGAERSHRPLLEGLYAVQIARWLRVFDASQVKIVDSKKLFSEPEKTAADVAKFAGLSEHTFFEFGVDRESSCDPRRRSQKVSVAYYKRKEAEPNFRKWYADHNDMLAELIGQDFGWNDRIRSGNADPHSGFLRG
ncbi:unnamed protein product [Ascophyllum nodosum]